MYGPLTAHRCTYDRYLDKVFNSPPWAWKAHSKMLALGFNESFKKHWEEFAKDMNDSFGVKVQTEQKAAESKTNGAGGEHFDKTIGTADLSESASRPTKDFKVTLDLTDFSPEELSVKIVGNTLRVEANHESTKDCSHFMKSYTQEFLLPEDVDLDALKSNLHSNGMLSLTAPRGGVPQERAIPIDVAREEEPLQNTDNTSGPLSDKDSQKDS